MVDKSIKTDVIYVTVDEAELNELRAEVERLNDLVRLYGKRIEGFSREAAEARAEVERLRAALAKIDERATLMGQYSFGDMAREALGR